MKTAIIYYSMDGNCRYVAENLALNLGDETDIFKLDLVKPYPSEGFMKMLIGGFSALRKKKPQIMPLNFDAREYDNIILGTPVWAGTYAPPLRTFFMNNYILDKPISLFVCSSSGKTESTFKKLRESLEGATISSFELSLIDPYTKKKEENLTAIKKFIQDIK